MGKTRLLIITQQFTKDYAFQKEKRKGGRGGAWRFFFISADYLKDFVFIRYHWQSVFHSIDAGQLYG